MVFSGVVRDHAEGRDGVYAMTYEAYEGPAEARLREVAEATREQWPDADRVALHHRVGELKLGEASVLVAVSSPHRETAFAAAKYAIDAVKVSVPIWKKEHFERDSAWALGAHDVAAVSSIRERERQL